MNDERPLRPRRDAGPNGDGGWESVRHRRRGRRFRQLVRL